MGSISKMVGRSDIYAPPGMVEKVYTLTLGKGRLRGRVRLIIQLEAVQSRNKCFLTHSNRTKAAYFTLIRVTVAQNRMG